MARMASLLAMLISLLLVCATALEDGKGASTWHLASRSILAPATFEASPSPCLGIECASNEVFGQNGIQKYVPYVV